MLADHALAHPQDNKLYVTGGGIRSLPVSAFPATWPRLSLVLSVEFTAEELKGQRDASHRLQIISSGPSETPPTVQTALSFTLGVNPTQPDQPVYFHFVYNMENIRLAVAGTYGFSIVVDDQKLGEIPLRAVKVAGPVLPSDESRTRISEGYQAYLRGDLTSAQAIFQDVVTRFPTLAIAHNNLGFLLLQRGEAVKAMEAFQKARELAFSQPEILDANVGCAHYLLGDPVAALLFFQQCLRNYGFREQGVLLGIRDQEMFPVQLNSAADYVSLMILDAAWSALRGGDRETAARYLEGADAADLGRREDESGRNFSESVTALKDKLG
jgi:hypothetical protein